MSAFLYRTRLYWDGYHGVAKSDGVLIELRSCPQFVAGSKLVSIDYAPEAHVKQLQEFNAPHRDMTPSEAQHCRDLLERAAINAREALNGS